MIEECVVVVNRACSFFSVAPLGTIFSMFQPHFRHTDLLYIYHYSSLTGAKFLFHPWNISSLNINMASYNKQQLNDSSVDDSSADCCLKLLLLSGHYPVISWLLLKKCYCYCINFVCLIKFMWNIMFCRKRQSLYSTITCGLLSPKYIC